jgi:hypothetical protein
MNRSKFPLGQTLATVDVLRILSPEEIQNALIRHANGEWGDCGPSRRRMNEMALQEKMKLVSVFHTNRGERFCIVTESDRLSTTIQLQDETIQQEDSQTNSLLIESQ